MAGQGEDGLKEGEQEAIYDRQVRVWGVEAQRLLSRARVLAVGMDPVVAEACKGLALAGVSAITFADDRPASEAPQSLLATGTEGTRAEAVQRALAGSSAFCTLEATSIAEAKGDFLWRCDVALISWPWKGVASAAEGVGVPHFVAGGSKGAGAWFFVNLCSRDYPNFSRQVARGTPRDCPRVLSAACCAGREELGMERESEDAREPPGDEEVRAVKEGGPEDPATASIVGGAMGQEAVKALSGSGSVVQTAFCFDVRTSQGAFTRLGFPGV